MGNRLRHGPRRRRQQRHDLGPRSRNRSRYQRQSPERRVSPRCRATGAGGGDERPGGGPGRRATRRSGGAGPGPPREPELLGLIDRAGSRAGEPDQGHRTRHDQANERGDERGRQGPRPIAWPSCPGPTWPARSPSGSRPRRPWPAPTRRAHAASRMPAPPTTSVPTGRRMSSARRSAERSRTSSRSPTASLQGWASARTRRHP